MAGGPFPTSYQADRVRELRREHGVENRLLFSYNAYRHTELAAYGIVEISWINAQGGTRRIMIQPDGDEVSFQGIEIS